MRKKKKSLVFIIILVLMLLGIGYAFLTTTLSINGVTDVDSNNWDVYFDNIVVTSGSVTGTQVIDEPEIDDTETAVSFHVNLKEPGDFYEFTVDAKNDGTIDAMIESVSRKLNGVEITTLPNYFNFTVTYENGNEIQSNHLLAAETIETYKVRVEYRSDIDPEDLPSTAQSLSVSFGVNYIQATYLASDPNATYTVLTPRFDIEVMIGEEIPSTIPTYYTISSAMSSFYNTPIFNKHYLNNNIVSESYIGFIMNNKQYYIKGDIRPYDENTYLYEDSPYYNDNKNVLNEAFGASNCETRVEWDVEGYYCYRGEMSARVEKNGSSAVYGDSYGCKYCYIGSSGTSGCSNRGCV